MTVGALNLAHGGCRLRVLGRNLSNTSKSLSSASVAELNAVGQFEIASPTTWNGRFAATARPASAAKLRAFGIFYATLRTK
jgi:hypothetical protein